MASLVDQHEQVEKGLLELRTPREGQSAILEDALGRAVLDTVY
ncbi:hypothetical protein [Dictyobacter aurantiacus]|uniref:Uncharacterized protein n=1 Tax=Dictyobacter aurantiacus TaxID=1936993 RepID=A0A401ZR30_9CHLR|nr:hypothetical protein [Dictyobacter aurantiacus]GCE09325.1 hypothetical protein KDAU_66540 [Dictyobacter aurantiacus]